MQADYIHSKGLIFKYLNPLNIVVTQGFLQVDPWVKLHITETAIMQLLDLPKPLSVMQNMVNSNRFFMAPEIIQSDN